MTAIPKFIRLESLGWWQKSQNDPVMEVVVHLGDTTLTLIGKDDVALTHWSLQTVRRLDSGESKARYSPDSDGAESLEIADETMVAALARLSASSRPMRSRSKFIVRTLAAALLATAVCLTGFYAVGALPELLAGIVTAQTRQEIGGRIAAALAPEWGEPCTAEAGASALLKLRNRLFADRTPTIQVFSGELDASHLPGGVILVGRTLLEDEDGPEPVAGFVLREWLRASASDTLADFFRVAGPNAAVSVVLGRQIDDDAFRRAALAYAMAEPAEVSADNLLQLFGAAGIPSTPFARTLDRSNSLAAELAQRDPYIGIGYDSLLNDADWLTLQALCEYGTSGDQAVNQPH